MKNVADFLLPHLHALCCFYKPEFPNIVPRAVFFNMLGERIQLEYSECIGNMLIGLSKLEHPESDDEMWSYDSALALEVHWDEDIYNEAVDITIPISKYLDVSISIGEGQTHYIWWREHSDSMHVLLAEDKVYLPD